MTRSHSGLAYALREIFQELPYHLENLQAALLELFWNIVFPTAVILAVIAVAGLIAKRIKRIVYPPSAAELHKEALLALQASYSGVKYQRAAQRQAELVLKQAIRRDATYLPAVLSLAALYIYRKSNWKAAISLLETTTSNSTGAKNNADVQSLLLDARALQAGHIHMIQSEIRDYEFLSVSFADTCSSSVGMNSSSSKTVEVSKKKKQ